jgi:hypothetical protein
MEVSSSHHQTYQNIVSPTRCPFVVNYEIIICHCANFNIVSSLGLTENFQVLCPDGSVSVMTGGHDIRAEFEDSIRAS